jgi:hypothetical protein
VTAYGQACGTVPSNRSLVTSLPTRVMNSIVSQDSSVGIATLYGLDGPGIDSRWGARYSALVQTGPGAHTAPYTMGTGSLPGLKRPGLGVEHPPHVVPRLKKK